MAISEKSSRPAGEPPPSADPPYPSPAYAWYTVTILMIIYVISFMDRQVINLMVTPIRKEFEIGDFQVSLLMGFGFALFYTFFGIPIGRLADTKSRRTIIAIGLGLWSMMTVTCGLARTYGQLLLSRMGVGVGEAALSPCAYSLITDYFPKHRLATAISVYSMGIYLGSGFAYIIPGYLIHFLETEPTRHVPLLGEIRSWQLVFLVVGLPGLAMIPFLYTIKEPFRRGARILKATDGKMKVAQLPFAEVAAYIGKNWQTFLCHNLGFALLSFSSYGSTAWIPTLLQRSHGMTKAQSGIHYGWIVGIAGTLGVLFGGVLADWLARRGYRDSKMRSGLIASVIWAPAGMIYPLLDNTTLVTILLIPAVFTSSMPFGAAPAAIQEMMPNSMRAQASAVYLFVINLVGLGIGPSAVGFVTQYVFKNDLDLRYSLLCVTTAAHIAATLLLWFGLKSFLRSMDRLKEWTAANS